MLNVLLVLLIISCCCNAIQVNNDFRHRVLDSQENNGVSVSGISSGGYMAVQFHVAFSSIVRGAGILAGGPYYCANGDVAIALSSCMTSPELIIIDELIASTEYAATLLSIDATSNLENSRVWLFSGTADTIVVQGVVEKLQEYYQYYLSSNNQIKTVFNYSAEHSFVTNSYGNNCSYLGPDYINNCDLNSAFEILSHIYDTPLNPPNSTFDPNNIIEIDQSKYIPFGSTTLSGLYSYAYAYVPVQCKENKVVCSYHMVFHGCEQTIPMIGDIFYMNTGYNEIADTNNIIILYPQALATDLNPKGCFDWWGFTGEDYASQKSLQMSTFKSMLDDLISTYNLN